MKATFFPGFSVAVLMVLAFAGTAMAGMDYYQDRNDDRFAKIDAKPFVVDKDVIVVIMREGIPRGGGYTYQYPRENPEPIMTDKYAVEGDLSMEIELVASDYSGVAVAIAGTANLLPYMDEGVLEFSIKGAKGGEQCQYVLFDDGVKSNGESLQVKLAAKSFGNITTEWQRIVIPLRLYGEMGVYWDVKNQREVTMPFNWEGLKGFRIEVRKDENKEFKVWIDDVVVKKVGPAYEGPEGYPFRNEI